MSERRKKDRYNETWTKDELTESLKKVDRKSSHRSEKSSRHRDNDSDDYHEKKDRRKREEARDSKQKSRSKHQDSPDRHHNRDEHERKREHRSGREEDDRQKRDDRHRKYNEDDHRVNGEDRQHHSKRERQKEDDRYREERKHKSSRDKHIEDEYSNRKQRSRDDDKRHKRRDDDYREKKDRRHREEERDERDENHRKRRDRDHREREEEDDEERRMRREQRRKEKEEYDRKKPKGHGSERDSRHDKQNDHRSEKQSRKYRDDDHGGTPSSDKRDSKRDKHRSEKRHKDSKREQKDDNSSVSSKSKKSSNSTYIIENKADDKKEEDEYNYDDDDFEDYADDFEDDEEVKEKPPAQGQDKMDELMRAIAAENERANSAQSSGRVRSTATSDRNDSPFSQTSSNEESNRSGNRESHHTMINFSAAKKSSASSKVKKRMVKRSKDLLNLIQLDSVSFDILEMAPVTEYNLYIKNYGNSNTTQASVQCNDDNMDQDIQTEIPDAEDKWSQHPPHNVKCSGGEKVSVEETDSADRERLLSTMRGSSMRLTKFMSRASKLIESILNEDEMWKMSGRDNKEKSKLSFCEGYVPLQTNLAYLQGRKAVHIASSQGASQNLIAVAFEPAATSFSTRIDRKGLVAVWDSRKPAIPEKILVCDARPTYCSFGSSKTYILFVGTDDGCVLAYDLREPGVHHQIVSLEKTRETVLRSPTYTTGYLEDGHSSPITCILSIGADSKSSEDKQIIPHSIDRQSHSGLAFQLASLEEAAKLCIWIVVEMLPEAEPDDDLGLSPYGKIKLLRSMNLKIRAPIKSPIPELQFRTTCVQFSYIDPNNFYVGTDTGHIVHCTQYQGITEDHRPGHSKDGSVFFNEIDAVSPVTSLDINPFQLFGASLILAGYEDGSLRTYLSDRELPVINWPFTTDGAAVTKVQWSYSRPSVFFVLDSSNKLHVWDLAIMHSGPIKTEMSQNKPICLFSLSNATQTRSPEIALAYEESTSKDKSMVEVHKLAPHFSQVTDSQELEQLTFLLQSLL